jgi:hypothetical protein
MDLADEFCRIKRDHREAIKKTAARVVLGPSVMRVFAEGTRDKLLPQLPKIDIDTLLSIKTQAEFDDWFDGHLEQISRIVDGCNHGNQRIRPGFKWGHSSKILALFVRDLVLGSHYFPDAEAERISFLLHVPIDGVIIGRLRGQGVGLKFRKIKDIDTRKKFYGVQHILSEAATLHGIPRVWFDDNWGDRQ